MDAYIVSNCSVFLISSNEHSCTYISPHLCNYFFRINSRSEFPGSILRESKLKCMYWPALLKGYMDLLFSNAHQRVSLLLYQRILMGIGESWEKVNEIIRLLKGSEEHVTKRDGWWVIIDPWGWAQKVNCCLLSIWAQVAACLTLDNMHAKPPELQSPLHWMGQASNCSSSRWAWTGKSLSV